MKKLLLLPALLLGTLASAQPHYNYEVTPLLGYTFTEGNINVEDYYSYGGEVQWNNLSTSGIKPELFFMHGSADYTARNLLGQSTDFNRVALHGVYDMDNETVVPFAKAGIGYENLSNPAGSGNTNSAFVDAGVGLKIFVVPQVALKAEALYMLKNNKNRYDNNLNLFVGLTIALDKRVYVHPYTETTVAIEDEDKDGISDENDQCLHTPQGVEVDEHGCALDDDNDGIANMYDECPNTQVGVEVNSKGCALDSDNDGVIDSDDRCPNTPYGEEVDQNGCQKDSDHDGVIDALDACPNTPLEVKEVDAQGCFSAMNLNINFDTGSAHVTDESMDRIHQFADFLKTVPLYDVTIVGYTDNVGTQQNNLRLSQRRADKVRELLIQDGVDPASLRAIGKGENDPVASNDTAEGRAQNRRIEAHLTRK